MVGLQMQGSGKRGWGWLEGSHEGQLLPREGQGPLVPADWCTRQAWGMADGLPDGRAQPSWCSRLFGGSNDVGCSGEGLMEVYDCLKIGYEGQ